MNSLSEIKKRKYTGYIWMSDKEDPIVLNNKEYDFESVKTNPFIIEALLYHKSDIEEVSLTIKHTGKYHINEIDLKNLPEGYKLENIDYLPHRLNDDKRKGVSKVCFKKLWLPENDDNCNGWPVLKMKAIIFTGFKFKK